MTTAPDRLADPAAIDAVQVAIAWLTGDADFIEQYAAGDATRVSGDVHPPFPRLLIRRLPGGQEATRWMGWQDLRLTAYDDPAGDNGSEVLRQLWYGALRSLLRLTTIRSAVAGAVVTGVECPNGSAEGSEIGRTSPTWAGTVRLYMHPDPDAES